MRKWWIGLGIILATGAMPAIVHAEYKGGTIKIGVLNDQSGLYSDIAGTASIWMAKKAVEDFGAAAKGMKVEIIGGDRSTRAPGTSYQGAPVSSARCIGHSFKL